jgi:hypothetical protein
MSLARRELPARRAAALVGISGVNAVLAIWAWRADHARRER